MANTVIRTKLEGDRVVTDSSTKFEKTYHVICSFDLEVTPDKKLSPDGEAYLKTAKKIVIGVKSVHAIGHDEITLEADKNAITDIKSALAKAGVLAVESTMTKADLEKTVKADKAEIARLKAMVEKLSAKGQTQARKGAKPEGQLTEVALDPNAPPARDSA